MEDTHQSQLQAETAEDVELLRRRDFLKSLRKWSPAVIGGVVLGALLSGCEVNTGWVNRGGGWANRGAAWLNGAGGWNNRGGNWINRGGTWNNRGGGWVNRGGGGWVNRGGGGWVNRRGR